MAKKISNPNLKVGDWVVVLKGNYSARKGSFAVVAEAPEKKTAWNSVDNTYPVTGYTVRIVYNTPDGSSSYTYCDCNTVSKINPPRFLVGWNTECNDPMMYFKTLAEAKAFVAKLKKRKGMGNKMVEAGIFTRN